MWSIWGYPRAQGGVVAEAAAIGIDWEEERRRRETVFLVGKDGHEMMVSFRLAAGR